MRRSEHERKRLAVADALRNEKRLLILADNALIDDPAVLSLARERYRDAIMAKERALSDLIVESANAVLITIQKDARFEREATVLQAVLSGSSVQSAARKLGRSREYISNTAWRTVTSWVLDEFERRRTVRYTARSDGSEERTVVNSRTLAPSP